MEISKEQRELLKKRFQENGDCRSCGWHAGYHEVQESIEEDFVNKDFQNDGSIYIPCMNPDQDEEGHRGSNIYNFRL